MFINSILYWTLIITDILHIFNSERVLYIENESERWGGGRRHSRILNTSVRRKSGMFYLPILKIIYVIMINTTG